MPTFQLSSSTEQSYVSMRSDETWDGNPVFGTAQEILNRDEWIMLRMNQYGAPSILIIVSSITL